MKQVGLAEDLHSSIAKKYLNIQSFGVSNTTL